MRDDFSYPGQEYEPDLPKLRRDDNGLGRLRQAIIDNTRGDLFWIGEILLAELEKETGFKS